MDFYNSAALEGGGDYYNSAALEGGFKPARGAGARTVLSKELTQIEMLRLCVNAGRTWIGKVFRRAGAPAGYHYDKFDRDWRALIDKYKGQKEGPFIGAGAAYVYDSILRAWQHFYYRRPASTAKTLAGHTAYKNCATIKRIVAAHPGAAQAFRLVRSFVRAKPAAGTVRQYQTYKEAKRRNWSARAGYLPEEPINKLPRESVLRSYMH